MKKISILSILLGCTLGASAAVVDMEDMNGVPYIPDFYSRKISQNGTQLVGDVAYDAAYYNIATKEAYFYSGCSYGKGNCISNDGTLVGCILLDEENATNRGVYMVRNTVSTPPVLMNYSTSNIHSITPDASRVCGVVNNAGQGVRDLPFYSDLTASGTLQELQFLPIPPKDFFGMPPMHCAAYWMSNDGQTIAGHIGDFHGFYYYPIVWKQQADGSWDYFFPSEKLFNMDHLEVPQPLGDMEDEYPGIELPDIYDYVDSAAAWDEAVANWSSHNFAEELDPYTHLTLYMSAEKAQEYTQKEEEYYIYVEIYNIQLQDYYEKMDEIAASSVLFCHSNMALSPDGKWLLMSQETEGNSQMIGEDDIPNPKYTPWLFNLETGEYRKIETGGMSLNSNQVFYNGNALCVTPARQALPTRTWIYNYEEDTLVPFEEYLLQTNPQYGNWIDENLSGEIPVAEDEDGNLVYEFATVSGHVAANENLTVIAGGVDGYALDKDMEFTYVLSDLISGVDEILAEKDFDGVYNVFNLQGMKVVSTRDKGVVENLAKGIYIINGKKILKN